jgi:hypothetical protein
MARGNNQAQGTAGQANANANMFTGNATNLYAGLEPQLSAEATNPAGYSAPDLAAMQTGAQQSAGGTQAAAVGQGGLLAARTRNAGGPAAAIADASRGAGEQLSKNALGITVGNARLKQQQQQEGLSGLTNLTGLETSAGNTALGQVAPLVNANTNAVNSSYDAFKDIVDPVLGDITSAGTQAIKTYGA